GLFAKKQVDRLPAIAGVPLPPEQQGITRLAWAPWPSDDRALQKSPAASAKGKADGKSFSRSRPAPAESKGRRAPKEKRKAAGAAPSQQAPVVAVLPREEQVAWLQRSFDAHKDEKAPADARELLSSSLLTLSHEAPLNDELLKLIPDMDALFCFKSSPETQKGAPRMLFVSSAAIAASQFGKKVPSFVKVHKLGKLFAKHFKVEEQETALRTSTMPVAAGTPHRLATLAERGSLHLEGLQYVLLDVEVDAKRR
ncbi:hypothetical protein H632_c846p0, partial [Helicosporidium sp. ATCC 50920]